MTLKHALGLAAAVTSAIDSSPARIAAASSSADSSAAIPAINWSG